MHYGEALKECSDVLQNKQCRKQHTDIWDTKTEMKDATEAQVIYPSVTIIWLPFVISIEPTTS